jgi:YegS/Rv2252/BmrU family lipid kinase
MHVKTTVPIESVKLFANPIAGRGQGRAMARTLARELRAAGMRVSTQLKSPATLDEEDLIDADAVIAIGGDGTLRAVVGTYLARVAAVPPILPVPMGTANLMGRHLGIDWQRADLPQRVVQSLLRGKICKLDCAVANEELFLIVAGVGMDARIVHELDSIRKGPINFASYLLPAAFSLAAYNYPALAVRVDGREIFPESPAVAFVGNISEYGTGFPMLPGARPDDGLLDVCVIPVRSPIDAVQQFLRAAVGEHTLGEGVVYVRGKEIQITSSQKVPLQLDGDPAGHTPVNIRLLPVRVPFIVPA